MIATITLAVIMAAQQVNITDVWIVLGVIVCIWALATSFSSKRRASRSRRRFFEDNRIDD